MNSHEFYKFIQPYIDRMYEVVGGYNQMRGIINIERHNVNHPTCHLLFRMDGAVDCLQLESLSKIFKEAVIAHATSVSTLEDHFHPDAYKYTGKIQLTSVQLQSDNSDTEAKGN